MQRRIDYKQFLRLEGVRNITLYVFILCSGHAVKILSIAVVQ